MNNTIIIIKEETSIWAILAYNNESSRPTWCFYRGTSARLLGEPEGQKDAWLIRWANGDEQAAPKSEVYLRGRI
jgi:hypothetical protein